MSIGFQNKYASLFWKYIQKLVLIYSIDELAC
jgi:hypothetical protein